MHVNCKFVLLIKIITLVRPKVFKVASQMAKGHSFCLAVLVFNIYKRLVELPIFLKA